MRAFKKCGISTAADGSEDFEIHLEGLEDYTCSLDDMEAEEGDPFADLSDDTIEESGEDDESSCEEL